VRANKWLFGDSLTQLSFLREEGGWGLGVVDWYAAKADVFNRGFSGYNTRAALKLLPAVFPQRQALPSGTAVPVMVTVLWGANDAALPGEHSQHVPVDEYEDNLVHIAEHLRAKAAEGEQTEIVFISPPPVEEKLWEQHCISKGRSMDRSATQTPLYAAACKRAAERAKVHFIDLHHLIMDEVRNSESGKDLTHFLNDGLHLARGGNEFLFQQLKQLISTKITHLNPEGDELFDFPHWSTLF
jgi:lysophospholipase L1-like esterase